VVYLDCQNVDTALTSFATACRRPVAAVAEAVLSHGANWTEYEPRLVASGPREMFRRLDLTSADVSFEGAYYFHGSRVFDRARFAEEGILPLGQVIDRLWTSLHTLVADTVTEADWRQLRADIEAGGGGHSGSLYRLKTNGSGRLGGPYALLARQHHLPRDGHHNYLAIPEIVEDIARCCGLDLAERFRAATTPCIVKFRTASMNADVLNAGFWYIHGMLHDGMPGWLAQCDYDGRGKPVLQDEVVAVELIDNRHGLLARTIPD
jgi:hypothetical protein